MTKVTKIIGRVPYSRGEYQSGIEYYKQNIVFHNGSSFIALTDGLLNEPTAEFVGGQWVVSDGWGLFAYGSELTGIVQDISQLAKKIYGEIKFDKNWITGRVRSDLTIDSNVNYKHSEPFLLKIGETIQVKTSGAEACYIAKCDEKGDNITSIYTKNFYNNTYETLQYVATEDTYIIVTVSVNPSDALNGQYEVHILIDGVSITSLDKRVSNNETEITSIKSREANYENVVPLKGINSARDVCTEVGDKYLSGNGIIYECIAISGSDISIKALGSPKLNCLYTYDGDIYVYAEGTGLVLQKKIREHSEKIATISTTLSDVSKYSESLYDGKESIECTWSKGRYKNDLTLDTYNTNYQYSSPIFLKGGVTIYNHTSGADTSAYIIKSDYKGNPYAVAVSGEGMNNSKDKVLSYTQDTDCYVILVVSINPADALQGKYEIWFGSGKESIVNNAKNIKELQSKISNKTMRFAMFTDLHYNNSRYDDTSYVYDSVTEKQRIDLLINGINKCHAEKELDFVLCCGDIIDNKGDNGLVRLKQDFIDKIKPRLFCVHGNHDNVSDEVWANVLHGKQGSFIHGGYYYILLDVYKGAFIQEQGTLTRTSMGEGTKEFFEAELKKAKSLNLEPIVALHDIDEASTEDKNIFYSYCVNYGCKIVLLGHAHYYKDREFRGVIEFNAGWFAERLSHYMKYAGMWSTPWSFDIIELTEDGSLTRTRYVVANNYNSSVFSGSSATTITLYDGTTVTVQPGEALGAIDESDVITHVIPNYAVASPRPTIIF